MKLRELRSQVRSGLASRDDWSDEVLDQWVVDGVRLYSASFPRLLVFVATVYEDDPVVQVGEAGQVVDVLSVEFPIGESPRRFWRRVPIDSLEFESGGDYYAITAAREGANYSANAQQFAIVLAAAPATDDVAAVEAVCRHDVPRTDSAVLTVPDAHLEAISAYVAYRAASALEMAEAVTVDTSNVSIVLAQLGQSVRSAWRRYQQVMGMLADNDPVVRSQVVRWGGVGGVGRVY